MITNGIWVRGANKKGVLVYSTNTDVKLQKMEWINYGMRVFIPIMVKVIFPLVAVWTTKPAYIEEFYIWHLANREQINKEVIILGDCNSNAIWDNSHRKRGHLAVVEGLKKRGLESIYHCFANPKIIQSYDILDDEWLELSDHLPIVLEISMEFWK